MTRAIFATVIASGGLLVLSAAPAMAQHPGVGAPNVPVVDPHQHYVVTPNGNLPIGPNACENGKSLAFDHFHFNVHAGKPGMKGTVVATACPSA